MNKAFRAELNGFGAALAGVTFLPGAGIGLMFVIYPGVNPLVVVPIASLPALVSVAVAGYSAVKDRRAAVRLRLVPADRPTQVVLDGLNATIDAYPIEEFTSVEVGYWSTQWGVQHDLRLRIGGGVHYTGHGNGRLPARLPEGLRWAEVEVRERDLPGVDAATAPLAGGGTCLPEDSRGDAVA
jgi:hypothetical protein